jgi:hypothetical protein
MGRQYDSTLIESIGVEEMLLPVHRTFVGTTSPVGVGG